MAADPARLKELFLAAADLPSAERADLLDRECGDDAELRQRVLALLRAHDDSGGFLAQPAPEPAVTTDAAPGEPEAVGTAVGPYTLLQKLGEGGMGTVWVAEQHQPVKRRVALKVIKPGMDSAHVVRRFAAERQALAVMDHTNIAKVFDAGTTAAGRPYFVMELVHGVPITKYCDELHLPIRERLALFVPVCQAVQHAHQKGIIHRDLKPSNVLVCLQDGKPVPKVIDFGVAKALHQNLAEGTVFTEFGAVVGTLEYMSPEQAEVSPLGVDTRADVYALGVLLYELLTGTTPLSRQRLKEAALAEVLRLIKEEEPPRPSTRLSESKETLASIAAQRRSEPGKLTREVRGELDWIVMRCLEKDRGRRYETASGLALDVERYLADEPVEACPPSAGYRLRKLARKHRGLLTALAACVLLLVAGAAVSSWQAVRATLAEQDARELATREEQQRQTAEYQRGEAQAAAAAEKKARQAEAVERARAEKAEGQAKERLADVTREKDRADREARLARAVSYFLQQDLLKQADSRAQVESGFTAEPKLTVKEALDRAADKIARRFAGRPLEEATVRETIGSAYRGSGEYRLAAPHHERAWALREKHLGPDKVETLNSLSNLAAAYREAGQVKKALPLLQRVLAGDTKLLGPDHELTLGDMNNLAMAYKELDRLEEAVELFEKVKAKIFERPRRDSPALFNLAHAYLEAGMLDKAIPLAQEVLAAYEAHAGPSHPYTLITLNILGQAYMRAHNLDSAMPRLKEALRRCNQTLGPDHPTTLWALNNLGAALVKRGEPGKAVPLLQQALAGREAKLGPDHRQTIISKVDLGMAYLHAGQTSRALPLLVSANAQCERILGPDHRDTLGSMNNLAVAYRRVGQPGRAVPLLEHVLAKIKDKDKRDPAHFKTLVALHNLAVAYLFAGQPEKAAQLLGPALPTVQDKLGSGHQITLSFIGNLASAYEQAAEPARAEPHRRNLLEQARKRFGPGDPRTAGAIAELGQNLLKQKKYTEAEAQVRQCLAIRDEKQPDHWLTFNTKSMLGGALLGQKKYNEAEPLLLDGYRGMKAREKAIPPEAKMRLTEAVERLAQLYEAAGPKEKAADWSKALASLKLADVLWQDLLSGKEARHRFAETARHKGALAAGKARQAHEVELHGGRTYVLDLESRDFDPVLLVEDQGGARLAENDDISPVNLNSRIIFTAPASGTYRLVATAFKSGAAGDYELRVRQLVEGP